MTKLFCIKSRKKLKKRCYNFINNEILNSGSEFAVILEWARYEYGFSIKDLDEAVYKTIYDSNPH